MSEDHDTFIRQSIELARNAKNRGDHPFGALLVSPQGVVLLTAENTVVTQGNPTHHAELNLIQKAWSSGQLTAEEIHSATLYTSCEPCPMCTGAIFWSGVRTVVYSLSATRLGEIANDEFCGPCTNLFDRARETVPTKVIGPILEKEGEELHLGFW
eukprot:gene11135-12415_t